MKNDQEKPTVSSPIDPVVICKFPSYVLSEIEGYLTAAAAGSMSRNNSEALADELLELIDKTRM